MTPAYITHTQINKSGFSAWVNKVEEHFPQVKGLKCFSCRAAILIMQIPTWR